MNPALETIKRELDRRQKVNRRYSLRAFARDLEISPAQLSQVLSGRRPLTPGLATRVAEKLDLSPIERKDFLSSTVLDRWPDETPKWAPLDEDRFQLIADWKHFAILSLTRVRGARGEAGWIATRLGLSYAESSAALDRLRRLGLVTEDPANFKQIGDPIHVGSKVPSTAIRRYHRETLELALRKLEEVPVERRDYSSVTITMNEADLEKFRDRIMKFQEDIGAEAEANPTHDVYMFACQLFPVTRGVSS